MMDASIVLAWVALAFAVTITPGPDTILVVSHTARGGLRAGMLANAGVQVGGLWYAALFGFGLLAVLVAVPAIFLAVKIAGAIYLAWLGLGMVRRALKKDADAERGMAKPVLGHPFLQGLVTNVLNPKVALFYLAALPQFVPPSSHAAFLGAGLILIHYAIASLWMALVAVLAHGARAVTWNRNLIRWTEGAIGSFFVAVAGRLALTGR